MQSLLWLGLIVATGACVSGFARIFGSARNEMKSRRRTQQVRRWIQAEVERGGGGEFKSAPHL